MADEDALADLTPEQRAAVDALAGALQRMTASTITPATQAQPMDTAVVAEDENGQLSKSESEGKFFYNVRLPSEFFPETTLLNQSRAQLGLFLNSKYAVDEKLALECPHLPFIERSPKGRQLNFEINAELHDALLKALKN